jgi:BioD-like phosphotransacetylase family protein
MTSASDAAAEAGTRAKTPSILLVGGLQPRAGKTALTAALSVTLAYSGRRMLALRLRGETESSSESLDAAYFQTLPFARGRGGSAVDADAARQAAQEQAQSGCVLVLEAPEGADLSQLAEQLDAAVILAVRSADATAMKALGDLAGTLGGRLAGVVAMAVPQKLTAQALAALSMGPAPVLGVIPEDSTLYAPSVLEIADALDAEVVLGEPQESDMVERLMIGAITTDPGQPYYSRPRSRRAAITRSDKTDLQLAAMHSDIDCLILTGGVEPSPYTIDRAADEELTVLLTRADTRASVEALQDIFARSRFGSEEKLERMRALLDEYFDWAPLKHALGLPE